MNTPIDQLKIINHLNHYFNWHNLPVRMNRDGVCNGLATVYVKYALQGRLDVFQAILERIATLTITPDYDEEINQFAKEVATSFLPEEYNKKLNQHHSLSMLAINGRALKPAYELGITTQNSNWAQILKAIHLQDDEAMLVRSITHTVAISKKQGKYIIYDPNYSHGFKAFTHEKDVIEELHFNVFGYTGMLGLLTDSLNLSDTLSPIAVPLDLYGPLSLHIQVARHPDHRNRPSAFPDIGTIFNQYLNTDQVALLGAGECGVTNMYWAIAMDNVAALEALYAKGFQNKKHLITACRIAAAVNATQVLSFLLRQIKDPGDIAQISAIFTQALINGRKEALDLLIADPVGRACFEDMILMPGHAATALSRAAEGGNVDVLQFMLDSYRNDCALPLDNVALVEKILAGQAIPAAIKSKSVACVTCLLRQMETVPGKRHGQRLLAFLLLAVQSNQPDMVTSFIQEIYKLPKEEDQSILFDAITLSTRRVEKTDIAILQQLRKHGVQFSMSAQAVIAQKENRPTGFLLPLGVMLYKFTDYIKEVLLKRSEIKDSLSLFKKIKSNMAIKNADDDDDEQEFGHAPGAA